MLLNKIDRYIFKTVFNSFLIITIIFCILFFIFTYLAQVTNDNDNYTTWELILGTLYQLPSILYLLLPACAMIGSLMGLTLLAGHSEIIVLRASGRSTTQIARGVILVGLIGSITTIIFGGYIAPLIQKLADSNLVEYNIHNIWLKTPDGVMHIGQIDLNKKSAYDIRKFIIKHNKLEEVNFAKEAKYTSDTNAEVFQISKLAFPIKDRQKEVAKTSNIEKDKWVNPLSLSVAQVITINDNNYLDLSQLTQFMLSDTQAKNDALNLKFWQEIFQPISLMVMILLSVPLSIGSNRSSTFIVKLLLGAFFGFIFFIFNQIFGPIALILHISPIFGAAGPTFVAIVLLIYLFIKSKEINI